MNSRKAKALRKLIFQNKDFRERTYGVLSKGQVINTGQLEYIGYDKQIALRRIYKNCKKLVRRSRISHIPYELFENPMEQLKRNE